MTAFLALFLLLADSAHATEPTSPRKCPSSTAPRTSPCLPSEAEKKLIIDAVNAALDAQADPDYLGLKIDEAAKQGTANSGSFEDRVAWEASYKAYARARQTVQAKFQHAIVLAQQLYGVGSSVTGGEPQGGPFQENSASWQPQVWDDEAATVYRARRADGSWFYLPRFDEGDYGITEPNGNVFLSMGLFHQVADEKDPMRLALSLANTGGSFSQLVKTGWENEHAAKSHALHKEWEAAIAILGPDDDVTRDLLGKWQLQGKLGANSRLPSPYPSDEDSRRHEKDWRSETEGLRQALQARLDNERQERHGDDMHDAPNNETAGGTDPRFGGLTQAEIVERVRIQALLFCLSDDYITDQNLRAWSDLLARIPPDQRWLQQQDIDAASDCHFYVAYSAVMFRQLGVDAASPSLLRNLVNQGHAVERARAGQPTAPGQAPSTSPPPQTTPSVPLPNVPDPEDGRSPRPGNPPSEPCFGGNTCGPIPH